MNTHTPAQQATQPPITLPLDGLSRASQILPFLPFGQATLWAWSKCGKFPTAYKTITYYHRMEK